MNTEQPLSVCFWGLTPPQIFVTPSRAPHAQVWDVELAVYERSPTTPISTKTAARTSTVSLAFSCAFDPADKGFYPPRYVGECPPPVAPTHPHTHPIAHG